MKKKCLLLNKSFVFTFLIVFSFFVFGLSVVSANCLMNVTLLNQDPFPAVPGEYVEVVFQLSEANSGSCKGASIQVIPSYPFSLANGENDVKELFGPRWLIGYKRAWMIPYRFVVDKNALDGWHDLEVRFAEKDVRDSYFFNLFEIKVEQVVTDFEVAIRDYDFNTKEMTLEVLNVGSNDVEALVIDIPSQENIKFAGSNQRIIGVLDSNEDTSVRFKFSEVSEGDLEVIIKYNDKTNERREVRKNISFNPDLFKDTSDDNGNIGFTTYLLIGIIIILVLYIYFSRKKKK